VTGLVTLREPIVTSAGPGIPELDEDGHPLDWSHRQAAGLRFEHWRAARGDFDGDRFGLRPEPLPGHDDNAREGWRS
jgi:hypothetical protein